METGHKSFLNYDVKPYVIYYYPYHFSRFRRIVKATKNYKGSNKLRMVLRHKLKRHYVWFYIIS